MQPGQSLTRSACEKAFGTSNYKVLSFESRGDSGAAQPGT